LIDRTHRLVVPGVVTPHIGLTASFHVGISTDRRGVLLAAMETEEGVAVGETALSLLGLEPWGIDWVPRL